MAREGIGAALLACAFTFAARAEDVEFSGGATFIVQQIVSGEDARLASGRSGEMTASFDLCGAAALAPDIDAFVHVEASRGEGADRLVDAAAPTLTTMNADAGGAAGAEVTEAWIEASCSPGCRLSCGQVDVSALFTVNPYAGDETTQFLNGAFRECPAAVFPADNAAAAWLSVAPDAGPVELVLGWAETDADWQDTFVEPYLFAEVALRLGAAPGDGCCGHVRLFGWSAGRSHPELIAVGAERSTGWGVAADARVARGVGVFARYGARDGDVFDAERAFALGCELCPRFGQEDAMGFAFARACLSDAASAMPGAEDESVLEAYYRRQVSDRLALTSDLQVVWDAGGLEADPVVVFGLRAQVDF